MAGFARTRGIAQALSAAFLASAVSVGCGDGRPPAPPSIVPGSSAAPREVNLIARDYAFVPAAVELVPGETVLLHVVNAGLVVHEAVIGDAAVQEAWELAEAVLANAPPGPTPVVTVPADVTGWRVVVTSGQRVDLTWTVPADAAVAGSGWTVACHIPGHLAKGMAVPVRWVTPEGDARAVERANSGAPRATDGTLLPFVARDGQRGEPRGEEPG